MHLVARATKGVVSTFCGANVDSGANAEASEATGAWISVLGNLRIPIWINGTAIIRPIAGLNGYIQTKKPEANASYLAGLGASPG